MAQRAQGPSCQNELNENHEKTILLKVGSPHLILRNEKLVTDHDQLWFNRYLHSERRKRTCLFCCSSSVPKVHALEYVVILSLRYTECDYRPFSFGYVDSTSMDIEPSIYHYRNGYIKLPQFLSCNLIQCQN